MEVPQFPHSKNLPVASIDRKDITNFLIGAHNKPLSEYSCEDLKIFSSSQIARLPYHIIIGLLENPFVSAYVLTQIELERVAIAEKHQLEGVTTDNDGTKKLELSVDTVRAIFDAHDISMRERLILAGRIAPIIDQTNPSNPINKVNPVELTFRSILFNRTLENTNYTKIENGGLDALEFWQMIPTECRVKYIDRKADDGNPSFLFVTEGLKATYPKLFPQQK